MCGIAGLVQERRNWSPDELARAAGRMADTLQHRGPDDGGVWVDAEQGIALGHRRLSILDLSQDGHQPMVSASGRFVVVYNGEIYNFPQLKRELEAAGHRFRGHSDTEVLLAAIEHWGLPSTLARSAGMFALALWDRHERQLHLVRDRLGKKPLYFGWVDGSLLFASELKAFHAFPGFKPEIDRGALALLLRHMCVPSPYSIYRDVFKLPPASRLSLRLNGSCAPRRGREVLELIEPYWSAVDVAERGSATPLTLSDDEAVDRLDEVLSQAVGERMISDVPLGALLSGGIDSSIVVALMQRQSSRPVKTFTIGLHEPDLDEAADARRIADHLGTDHSELYVTPEEAQAVIPRLPEFYDEPFADQSQIPTFLVSQLARRDVTVVLSGDGGDELFGGYQRHFQAGRLARYNRVPPTLRAAVARLLTTPSPDDWDRLFDVLGWVLPGGVRRALTGDKVHKFAGVLPANGLEAAYRTLTSHWQEPTAVVRGAAGEPPTVLSDPTHQPDLGNYAHVMMALDTISYLPDDVLTKVDRASMAVSLEARAPLLDHRVVEFAWQLPLEMKIRGGKGKWILRRLLERHVPRELFERPKQGFGIPIGPWLRGPLRGWAEALLAEDRLRDEGFFEPQPIRQKWAEHLAGRRNWAYHLWDVLMFQAWRERWAP